MGPLGMSRRLVLRGARHPGDVAVVDGRIVGVGTIASEPGDEVVRCDGDIITAGLVQHPPPPCTSG